MKTFKPIGYADHLKIYYIKHSVNDYVYFRFCNGKMKKAKISYFDDQELDCRAHFYVENTLRYNFDEIMRADHAR